jgi:hypothetical protein
MVLKEGIKVKDLSKFLYFLLLVIGFMGIGHYLFFLRS